MNAPVMVSPVCVCFFSLPLLQLLLQVNAATGADEFLISWLGYGPYWDSWEGIGCLEGPLAATPGRAGRAPSPASSDGELCESSEVQAVSFAVLL
jgi:hypothetical protein